MKKLIKVILFIVILAGNHGAYAGEDAQANNRWFPGLYAMPVVIDDIRQGAETFVADDMVFSLPETILVRNRDGGVLSPGALKKGLGITIYISPAAAEAEELTFPITALGILITGETRR